MADITVADGPRVHLQDDDKLVRVGRSTFDLEYCVRARARAARRSSESILVAAPVRDVLPV